MLTRSLYFAEAFRAKNKATFKAAVAGNNAGSKFLKSLVDRNWHFADCAIQYHSGKGIEGNDIAWHHDAENSALHLALAVRGKRTLHAKLAQTANSEQEALELFPQQAGDVYVSTPFCFEHGVQYSDTTRTEHGEGTIIACQIRFLFTAALYAQGQKATNSSCCDMMESIADALEQHPLVLPTLQEVQEVERKWEKQGAQ